MKVEDIAKVCHQANKAYCETLGDQSQVDWEKAPEWMRESAINGVKFHLSGVRHAKDSHDNWMKQKLADGWRYGETKDEASKTHPCIVEFKDLPEKQKYKDVLFTNICASFRLA